MLNSADFRSKTARAPARSPCCGKSSRGKKLIYGRNPRWCRAYEISRYVAAGTTAVISSASHVDCRKTRIKVKLLVPKTSDAMTPHASTSASFYAMPNLTGAIVLLGPTATSDGCSYACYQLALTRAQVFDKEYRDQVS